MKKNLLSDFFKPYTERIKEALKHKKSLLSEDKQIVNAMLKADLLDTAELPPSQDYADALIYNTKGELLLLRRTLTDTFCPGCFGLPGGKVDPGETPEIAVVREVKEETNLTVISIVKVMEKEIDGGCIYYFTCQVQESLIEPSIILDNEEHDGWQFVTKEQRKKLPLILDLGETLDMIALDGSGLMIPMYGEGALYSNIEEQIANTSNTLSQKDMFMITLLSKGEINDDDYFDYLEKAYGDPSHGGKLMKVTSHDKNGRKVTRWTTKQELKQLSLFAKNSPHKNLESAIKEHPHPVVRQAAHAEIARREKEEKVQDQPKAAHEEHPYHGKNFTYNKEHEVFMDEEGSRADIQKLHEYYDLREKDHQAKMNEMGGELEKLEKQRKTIKGKLINTAYKRIKSTAFKTDNRDEAFELSLKKIEKMGLSREDIDEQKVRSILNKKFNNKVA